MTADDSATLTLEIATVDPEHTFSAHEINRIIAAIRLAADVDLIVNVVHPDGASGEGECSS